MRWLPATIQFADQESEDPDKGRRFSMIAYTGASVDRWFGSLVVDLSGMKLMDKIPILLNHDGDRVVGFADSAKVEKDGLRLSGLISRCTEDGAKVANLAAEGFPWTASIGFHVDAHEEVKAGAKVEVNGKNFAGPVVVARKTHLAETSFITAGPADRNTEVSVMQNQQPPVPQPTEIQQDVPAPAPTPAPAPAPNEATVRERLRNEMQEYLNAFPESRRQFAMDQFFAGKTVNEAKAALCDQLLQQSTGASPQAAQFAAPTNVPNHPIEARPAAAPAIDTTQFVEQSTLDRFERAKQFKQIKGFDRAVAAMVEQSE